MGKYTKALKVRADEGNPLPKLPIEREDDPKYQDRVNEEKTKILAELGTTDPEKVAETLLAARAIKKEKEEAIKSATLRYDALKQILASSYTERGITSVKLVSGTSVSNEPEVVTSVKEKAVFHRWCIKNGHLPEMQLMWQTRNRIAKELLLMGGEDPDGLTIGLRDKIVVR